MLYAETELEVSEKELRRVEGLQSHWYWKKDKATSGSAEFAVAKRHYDFYTERCNQAKADIDSQKRHNRGENDDD